MDREIRFRAWDNYQDRMYHNVESGIYEDPDEIIAFDKILGFACYEVMENTGLKDKNKKDIYEGDIVSAFDGEIKAKIIYGFCGFEFEWITKHTAYIRMRKKEQIFSNVSIIFEVIGNVFENPELLKEGENNGIYRL